jgi:hypothetical protein
MVLLILRARSPQHHRAQRLLQTCLESQRSNRRRGRHLSRLTRPWRQTRLCLPRAKGRVCRLTRSHRSHLPAAPSRRRQQSRAARQEARLQVSLAHPQSQPLILSSQLLLHLLLSQLRSRRRRSSCNRKAHRNQAHPLRLWRRNQCLCLAQLRFSQVPQLQGSRR